MEIDFGYEFGLGGVGWTGDELGSFIVSVGIVARHWILLVDVRRRYVFWARVSMLSRFLIGEVSMSMARYDEAMDNVLMAGKMGQALKGSSETTWQRSTVRRASTYFLCFQTW
jgi:hypothetical protein